jgi:hypothetical protein
MKRTNSNYSIDIRQNKLINTKICNSKNIDELINIYNNNYLNYNYINLCTTVNRFVKISKNFNYNNFIIGLIPHIKCEIKNFKSREISNLTWSFATLNIKNIELFDLLAEES